MNSYSNNNMVPEPRWHAKNAAASRRFYVASPAILLSLAVLTLLALDFKPLFSEGFADFIPLISICVQLFTIVLLLSQVKNTYKTHLVTVFAFMFFAGFSVIAGVSTISAEEYFVLSAQRYLIVVVIGALFLFVISAAPGSRKSVTLIAGIMISVGVVTTLYSAMFELLARGPRKDELVILGIKAAQCTLGPPTSLRMCSLTGNPNTFAMLLIFAVISVIYLRTQKKIRSLSAILLIALLGYGHVLALSRTGIVATLFGAVTIILLQWIKSPPRSLQVLTAITLVIIGAIGVIQVTGDTRLLSAGLSGRAEIWDSLLDSIRANMWVGRGFGISSEAILYEAGQNLSGHNLYLVLLSEVGLPASLMFVGFYFISILFAIKKMRSGQPEMLLVATFLAAFLVHQIAEVHVLRFSSMNALFFIIAGLAIAPPVKGKGEAPLDAECTESVKATLKT